MTTEERKDLNAAIIEFEENAFYAYRKLNLSDKTKSIILKCMLDKLAEHDHIQEIIKIAQYLSKEKYMDSDSIIATIMNYKN